jgi:hypothetical protein
MVDLDARARLEAALIAAEAEVVRLRTENATLAEAFRAEPSDEGREGLKRAAASLASARDKVDAARAAIEVLDRTGSEHGLVASDGKVVGSIAVAIKPGTSREERERTLADALGAELGRAAEELGATLGASPERFVRERPGRDPEGRTVLDVAGRVEGDVLLPAVSRAAKKADR